jgi:hypothetical protein
MTEYTHDVRNPHVRLIVRLVRTLLADQAFGSLSDLTDALKWQCSRLRIRVTPDEISEAYRLIASNTHLTTDEPKTRPRYVQPETPPPLSRGQAARLVQALLGER